LSKVTREMAKIATLRRPPDRSASPWISPQDAAEYLGVSVDKIYDACARRGLKHAKLGHSTIRLRREWVDEWAEQNTRQHVAAAR
jgi:excisionase family DNA binding protein